MDFERYAEIDTMKIITLIFVPLLISTGLAQKPNSNKPSKEFDPPLITRSLGAVFEAKVLKIYSAKSPSGFEHRSCVVSWKGSEVVIDNIPLPNVKRINVGDIIKVINTETKTASSGKETRILRFMYVGNVNHLTVEEVEVVGSIESSKRDPTKNK